MYFAFYDEAGDDGYPRYSSPLFALTATYFHTNRLNEFTDRLAVFRRHLKQEYGVPTSFEVHTRNLLLGKNPYTQLGLSPNQRLELVAEYCDFIAELDLKIINVVIDKTAITRRGYNVFDTAVTYSIQRIENDLRKNGNGEKFFIFADKGRINKMRKVSRRVQKFNYIPSLYHPSSYRDEITRIVGDPVELDSRASHFIQLSDLVSTIVYLYTLNEQGLGPLPQRYPEELERALPVFLERLKPSLNTQAHLAHPFGIACYPKKNTTY